MEGGDLPAPTVKHLDRGGRRTSVVAPANANANANANRSGVGRNRGRGGAFQIEQQPLHHQGTGLGLKTEPLAVQLAVGGPQGLQGGLPCQTAIPWERQGGITPLGPQGQGRPLPEVGLGACGGDSRTQPGLPFGQQGQAGPLKHRRQGQGERLTDRLLEDQPIAGQADAKGREHPCQGMEQDPPHPELLGQGAGVLAAGTAVTDEHRLPDVVAALNRDHPDRRRHVLHSQRQGPLGHRLGRTADGAGQGRKTGPHRLRIQGLSPPRTKQPRRKSGLNPAEQHVGIRHRQRSAEAIGRRSRGGPRRGGTHRQTQPIPADQGATAGSHRVDRQHGSLQGQAGQGGLPGPLPGLGINTSRQVEGIRGGASHVKTEDRPIHQTRPPGYSHGPHQATGRSRQTRGLGPQ